MFISREQARKSDSYTTSAEARKDVQKTKGKAAINYSPNVLGYTNRFSSFWA